MAKPRRKDSMPTASRPHQAREASDPASVAADSPAPSSRFAALLAVFALALVAFAHSPALSGGFVWDDHQLIEEQRIVQELQPLSAYFTEPFWSSPYDEARGFFRPLVTLSYALEWKLWGGLAFPFHLTNLLFHLANCVLVFLLARMLRAGFVPSLAAALAFGLFPRLTESVSWISGRTDLIATFFALSAVLIHRRWGHRLPGRICAALAILLGLFCKEVALAGAVAIGVFELRHLLVTDNEGGLSSLPKRVPGAARRLVPLLSAGIVYAALRISSGAVVSDGTQMPFFPDRMLTGLAALAHYARMVLWPWKAELQIGDIGITPTPLVIAGAVILIAMAVLAWRLGIKRIASSDLTDVAAMGATALFLVLQFFPLAVNVLASDRFLYVPVASLSAIAASCVGALPSEKTRLRLCGIAFLVGAAFVPCTWRAASTWNDERTFWEAVCAEASPYNASAWLGLAGILDEQGMVHEALRTNLRSGRVALGQTPPILNLAQMAQGNIAQGIQESESREASVQRLQVLARQNGLSRHRKRLRLSLALVQARAGRFKDAIDGLNDYAAEFPDEQAPRTILSNVQEANGRWSSIPAIPLEEMSEAELMERYAVANLLNDRLAMTDVLLALSSLKTMEASRLEEALSELKRRGLCHRILSSGIPSLTNDGEVLQRCRPLPSELDALLPPYSDVLRSLDEAPISLEPER